MDFLSLLVPFLLIVQAHCQRLQLPLEISRPNDVTLGASANFSCKTADYVEDAANPCLIMAPNDRIFKVNFENGTVLDENDEKVSGFTGKIDPTGHTCGLDIDFLHEDDLGQWRCKMEHESGQAFHMGTFQLLHDTFLDDVRLPRHVVPDIYEITMIPFLEEGNFTTKGSLSLHFTFSPEGESDSYYNDKIVLHSKNVLIQENTVSLTKVLANIPIVGHEYDLEREFYVIHLDSELNDPIFLKSYTLAMDFISELNTDLVGLYRSQYTDPVTNGTKYLAVSQFESHYARRAFPCLDEPDRKARFELKVGHMETMTAETNMDIVSSEAMSDLEGYVMDTYRQSAIMSTYLVAFVVAEFTNTTSPLNETFHIWHIPSKAGQAALAADVGPRVLKYYETYFGIPYPLPKMDMAAIPDFSAGAMENWGLITYRESTLLVDDELSSRADKERVINVIAHEVAHQWFGNLVTMDWWTELWLNEGFATYVECIGTDFIAPNNSYRDRSILFDTQEIFFVDSLESAVPLSGDVTNPNYDLRVSSLSYSKGHSIIKMMENFLTTDVFDKGINSYLTTLQYSNANSHDLWEALNSAAVENGTLPPMLDVETIMTSWTEQPGYPVLTVSGVNATYILTLSQSRFFLNPQANSSDILWYIPVSASYPGDPELSTYPMTWLEGEKEQTLTIEETPYLLNVKETGYFRVNYDVQNWQALTHTLMGNFDLIDRLTRAQIVDDSLVLARANQLEYDLALEMTKYLKTETDYIPLEAGLTNFVYLDKMFRRSTNYEPLRLYITDLLEQAYLDLGFFPKESDDYPTVLKKISIDDWMCLYGQADCLQNARNQFDEWKSSPNPDDTNPIDPDLKTTVYKVAIREGTDSDFNFLYDKLSKVKLDADVIKIINGLGNSQVVSKINFLLEDTINEDSPIRTQDSIYVYRAVGETVVGRRAQFDWLKERFDAIKAYYGSVYTGQIEEILSGFMSDANTKQEIDELNAFLEDHRSDLGSAVVFIQQGIDNAVINKNWMDTNFETVSSWLNQQETTPTTTTPSSSSVAWIQISTMVLSIALIYLSR